MMKPIRWFIGWDVGGWNCDNNPRSRDAIAILNEQGELLGAPWRGNLRDTINQSTSSAQWIAALFQLCGVQWSPDQGAVVMAIDIPLAFSDELVALLHGRPVTQDIQSSSENPYLYRYTERYLFEHGVRPLSPIKDMIGAQATKGIHVLAKFSPDVIATGKWSDGENLIAFEGYPSPCKRSQDMLDAKQFYAEQPDEDREDAITCAILAMWSVKHPERLLEPKPEVSNSEGWIWIPRDVILKVG